MKKRILLWCSVLTLLICLLTGCTKSLEQQIAEQLELGQKYLAELNYEEAIVAFTKAIELDEKNVDAYIGRGQVYEAMAQAAGEESADGITYYEQAAGEYEQALSLSSENPFLYDRLLTIYQITGNLEGIRDLTEKDLSGITDEAVLAELEQVKAALEAIQKIADACEAGEIDLVFEFMNSEEFAVLQQFVEEMETQVFMAENGKGLGIYPIGGAERIYYGSYQDGLRQGHGLWIGGKGDFFYQAEGEWSNDVPNGYQEVRIWRNGDLYSITNGNVENGLWHGEILRTTCIDTGNENRDVISYEHGKPVVLRVKEGPEGGEQYKYVISEDEQGYTAIDDPNRIEGIAGFY